jgi:hypothetical protein
MFLESIISDKRNLFWFIFHGFLGLVCTVTPFLLILWFYIVFISNISKSISYLKTGKPYLFIALFAYLIGFEMLGRMAKTSPFIPVETSKYLLIIFGLLGMSVTGKYSRNFLSVTILISISLFIDDLNVRSFSDIINNYFGVLGLCLSVTFLIAIRYVQFNMNGVLKLILFSILPSLVYSFIKTPDFEDIDFNLRANFDTSGGAASNQVSTVFGLGLVICFYFWFKGLKLTGNRYLDLVIGLAFFAQALLTFSRGGIIVGILAVALLMLFSLRRIDAKSLFFVIITAILVMFIFNYIDDITEGKLALRYQGETEGTYNHGVEKDLKKITSGRSMIFEEDLKLWSKFPIFGCGVGVSRHIRGGSEDQLISSHVELSRLLAEHGVLGLIYFIALLSIGIQLWKKSRIDKETTIYFILFLIGFLTTFHSAMRTFVTPLLVGLSVIGIQSVKKKNANLVHRSNP